ncbi:MAG: di-heme oxidoredictase family protein [Pseudomonadota bacterium]
MTSSATKTVLVLLASLLTGCERVVEPLAPPGGSWTARPSMRATLIVPSSTLTSREKLDFWTGMGFFRDPWVSAPASTTARDGLGPLFNSQSCIGCHNGGGRGRSLLMNPNSVSTILKLGYGDNVINSAHPEYGPQLQTRATYPHVDNRRATGGYYYGEGVPQVHHETHALELPDGSAVSMNRMHVAIEGNDDPLVVTSARIAPSLIGLGLLEAIPEDALVAIADENDVDGDGISGRIHWRGQGEHRAAGRFGWKATHPTVATQTSAAFAEDIGISNPIQRRQNCAEPQIDCRGQRTGNDPKEGVEITQPIFERVVFFAAHIAPPPAAAISAKIADGRDLFADAGCDGCHTPSHQVDVVDADGLTHQERIWPYTDLLVHDMGAGLADALPEGNVSGSEWRTPPLWGLGKSLLINDETGLLHDGRAATISEAIAWHGGEASSSKETYMEFSAEERAALEAFVLAL